MLLIFLIALSALPAQAIEFRLVENGPERNFVYEQDPKALVTSVQIVFKTGSIHNPAGKNALAQMAFGAILRGTEKKSRKEYVESLERLGASLGVDSGSNRTILGLDAINENLPEALALLEEALLKPAFREEEIKAFKDEALGLLNQEASSNRAILKRLLRRKVYQDTAAATPPQGTASEVASITTNDMRGFLSSQITRENLIVAVASNLSKERVRALLEPILAKLPSQKPIPQPAIKLKAIEGRMVYLVDRKGSSTTEVGIAQPAIPAGFPERPQLDAGLFIFGTEFNSRLSTVLRKENGWTYGAYAMYNLIDLPRRYGGSFTIWTFPQKEHTEKAVLRALEMLEVYVKKGVTANELTYAKTALRNSYPFKLANPRERATLQIYQINDGAPFYSLSEYRRRIDSVTKENLKRAVQKVHNANNLAIVLVGDLEVTRPLAAKIPGVKQVTIVTDPMTF